MISNNIEDELMLLKNEEIYLNLLKEDLKENQIFEDDLLDKFKEEISFKNKINKVSSENPQLSCMRCITDKSLFDKYLSRSNEDIEINNYENKNLFFNNIKIEDKDIKTPFDNDIGDVKTNNRKNSIISKKKYNNFNVKNITENNLILGDKTSNKIPNKINSNNFSFANKYSNNGLLKSGIQIKDVKKI